MATANKNQEAYEESGDNAVKTAPGVPEGTVDRKVTDEDRAKANEEAVGGGEPIEATEADNPSPGRNAVPVSAPRTTKEGLTIPDGYEEKDLIPGTNVPQTAAPKAGDYTR